MAGWRQGWLAGLFVGAVLTAGEGAVPVDPPAPPPAPPVQIPRPAPPPPPVQGIEGRLAEAWGFRAPQAVDNTGKQYQNEKLVKIKGSGAITLELQPPADAEGAGAGANPAEGQPAAAPTVVAAMDFEGLLAPVIQTRQVLTNGQWQRYAVGVYFADFLRYHNRITVSTLEKGDRRVERKDDKVLVVEGETVMVDSASGIQVDQAYETLGQTRGVSLMEHPMLGGEQAVTAPRIPEARERPVEALGGIGPLLTMRLPADPQGAVDGAAGRSWKTELELSTVGGLPLKRTHTVPVNFTTVGPDKQDLAEDAILFTGKYLFVLGEDDFRGSPELLYAVGDLLRRSDLSQWMFKGAIGRGEIKLWYSPGLRVMVAAEWTEHLSQLNLQTAAHESAQLSGSQKVRLQITH